MPRPNTISAQLAEGIWYAEGASGKVAAAVLRRPALFDELFECLLMEDIGTVKRAAMALEIVSEKRADLFEPYTDILLTELETHNLWHVRFRLCPIVPRLALRADAFDQAITILRELSDHSQNALAVNALGALVALAVRKEELCEEILWLVEQKMHSGSRAMQSRCRQLLPRLHEKLGSSYAESGVMRRE